MKKFFRNFFATAALAGLTLNGAAQTTFTGSYAQNFDAALTNSGTALPPGFTSMAIAGANSTYTAASPITAAGIAAATADTQSLTVWNVGTAVTDSGSKSFNIGCWDSLNDRALGTDPTGTAAQVIQLSMTNNTGATLYGVTFAYACKCLTNGSVGTEASELPGYCFFYSTTGTNNATNWTEVGVAGTAALVGGVPTANGLCLPNFTEGTTLSSGPVNITFATPLPTNGIMYFRWADDNNEANSPDQMIAIDNITIASYNPSGPLVSITVPTNSQNFLPGSGVVISATATDLNATVTNVSFFANATNLLGTVTNSPYSVTATNLSIGAYALTAVAIDSSGLSSTSAVVNITVAHSAPTVSLTSPASGASFTAPATISLSANAAGTDGTVTNVAFYQGSTLLANVASSPYNFTWANVAAGAYTLTAKATDHNGLTTTSSGVTVTVTNSLITVFTGSYSENFDLDLSNSTTVLPPGFSARYLPGSHFTYTNGVPIDSNAIVTATVGSGASTLVIWNAGSAVADASYQLFNVGSWDTLNDRALGTDPTGTGGTVIQLAMTNLTGGSLPGVVFSYTEKCLTNGSTSNGSYTDDGTERLELPGYSFFYSIVGDTNASNWYYVQALSLTNWVEGTSSNSGPVTLTFPAPLANGGVMYFRWADDNCVASSPDQMYAIDNVSISNLNTAPQTNLFYAGFDAGPGFSSGFNLITTNVSGFGLGTYASTNPLAPISTWTFAGPMFEQPLNDGSGRSYYSINLNPTVSPTYYLIGQTNVGPYAATAPVQWATTPDFANYTLGTNTCSISNGILQFPFPVVSLVSPTNATNYYVGTAIPLTVNVSDSVAAITSLAYYIDGSYLLATVSNAPYAYTIPGTVPANTYILTAVATDALGNATTSAPVTVTVSTFSPVVSITSPTNGQNFLPGSSIPISATASESGGSVSNVAFYAGTNLLANVASSPYIYTWTGAANGSYALTAVAADSLGNVKTSSVVNITVASVVPVVSITSPANGASFASGGSIVISAAASESGGAISNVTFYAGSTLLGAVTAAPYSLTWSNVSAGSYTLTAVAKDVYGTTVTSGGVSLFVTNNTGLATLQQIKTFFIIPLENHDFVQANPTGSPEQLFGNPACPFFNSLITPGNSNAAQTAYATHYYSCAINGEHPSEPNYVWSEAGTDFGVRTDNDPSTSSGNLFSNVTHLSGQLTAAGISWKSYQEDVQYSSSPAVSASGANGSANPYNGTTEYSYAVKHNPMEFFTDTQGKNVYPLSQFFIDLTNNNYARYNWITPDQYNEMHSSLPSGYTYHGVAYTGDQAAIAEGDNFLSIVIPQIMASQAYQSNGVIIIWTDETESTDDTNTTLPYVIISPLAKGNAYASTLPYSHSSDLKTMDEIFGLAFQNNAIPSAESDAQDDGKYNYVNGSSATIYDLADFFTPVSVTYIAPTVSGVKLLGGAGGFQLTFSGPAGQPYEVLASDSITTPKSAWTVLASGTFGGTNVVYTDTRSPSPTNRYYVVKSP